MWFLAVIAWAGRVIMIARTALMSPMAREAARKTAVMAVEAIAFKIASDTVDSVVESIDRRYIMSDTDGSPIAYDGKGNRVEMKPSDILEYQGQLSSNAQKYEHGFVKLSGADGFTDINEFMSAKLPLPCADKVAANHIMQLLRTTEPGRAILILTSLYTPTVVTLISFRNFYYACLVERGEGHRFSDVNFMAWMMIEVGNFCDRKQRHPDPSFVFINN